MKPSGQNRQKKSLKEFLLIRHSKYSAILSTLQSYGLLFRHFAHWETLYSPSSHFRHAFPLTGFWGIGFQLLSDHLSHPVPIQFLVPFLNEHTCYTY